SHKTHKWIRTTAFDDYNDICIIFGDDELMMMKKAKKQKLVMMKKVMMMIMKWEAKARKKMRNYPLF
ncbi:hypothetical protein MKX03_017157, partial [Papaver bracteatum]